MGINWDGLDILDIVDILPTLLKITIVCKEQTNGQVLGWTGYPGHCGYFAHPA